MREKNVQICLYVALETLIDLESNMIGSGETRTIRPGRKIDLAEAAPKEEEDTSRLSSLKTAAMPCSKPQKMLC
jgi:hypothetical protein